jgi:hypothetical protein
MGGHVGDLRQKSLIKIILNWNTNMAAVTSYANALLALSARQTANFKNQYFRENKRALL